MEDELLPLPLPVEVASPPSPTPDAFLLESSHVASLSQSPVFKSLNHGASGCVTCGQGADGRLLHRLKHDGAVRHHCSSCILFYNKGMYCSQCFQVYRDASQLGDPALWLTCCKCLRLSHLECVRKRLCSSDSLDFSLFTCQECCSPSIRGESPTSQLMEGLCASISAEGRDMPYMASLEGLSAHKNLALISDVEEESDFADPAVIVPADVAACSSPEPARHSSRAFQDLSVQDQEAVAAANIVSALAANEAKEAKIRARATAAAAVKSAARAKAALDAAYRAAREEAKWKVEASRNFPAMAGQPTEQVMGGTQSGGVNTSEKRKLEAMVGNGDHSGQSMRIPVNQEDLGRNPKIGTYAPRSPRSGVASHKRRTLSAIAASEATRAHPSACMVSQHEAALFKPQQPRRGSPRRGDLADIRLHGSLDSVQEVTDQIREDPEHGLNAGPFVLANRLGVNASPASISESCSTLMGTPRADAVAGISETDASLLAGNDSLGHSHVPISGNGLFINGGGLASADFLELLPPPVTGNPVTGMCGVDGKLTNQPESKELVAFSPGSDEAVTDDLVDLGALIPGECEREVKLSNGCVPIQGDPASLGISVENALVTENTSADLSKPEADAGLGAITPTALSMYSEQSTGSQLAGELGKQAYEENAMLANKPFMEKIQRPIVLHMSVSNHGEKPMPYSVVKASVSTTCSAPLQTTALTSVPTGQHL